MRLLSLSGLVNVHTPIFQNHPPNSVERHFSSMALIRNSAVILSPLLVSFCLIYFLNSQAALSVKCPHNLFPSGCVLPYVFYLFYFFVCVCVCVCVFCLFLNVHRSVGHQEGWWPEVTIRIVNHSLSLTVDCIRCSSSESSIVLLTTLSRKPAVTFWFDYFFYSFTQVAPLWVNTGGSPWRL